MDVEGGFEIRRLLCAVKRAFPGSPETWKDVVHVEVWEYALSRFSEGGTAADIFSEVNAAVRVKEKDDAHRLVGIIERARAEWRDILPGARVVTLE